MASGDLNRIESAFAEAALDSGLWSRALNITKTASFGTTLLPLGSVTIPGALIPGVDGVVGPGLWLGARRRALSAIARRFARESMPFDMRPSTPSRSKKIRWTKV